MGGGARRRGLDRGRQATHLKANVGGVEGEWIITYRRNSRGAHLGYYYANVEAPGVEADAERIATLTEAITGEKPAVICRKDGLIQAEFYRSHLEAYMRYKELRDVVERWMRGRRRFLKASRPPR